MNKLDLAKVGKAFGFAVPPRVNISIGGGKGGAGRSGIKRKREDNEDDEDEKNSGLEEVGEDDVMSRGKGSTSREKGKERRIERLGKRKVEKEVYRKGGIAKKTRWSR